MAQLSAGVCLKLLQNGDTNQDLLEQEHIVQVLSVKSVSPDRFRVIFSDGIYYAQSMLATQMNHLATEKSIDKHTIIALEKLSFNIVQGRRLIIILAARVVSQHHEKIGDPRNAQEQVAPPGASSSTAAVPAPQQQGYQKQAATSATAKSNRPVYPIEGLSPYQNNWTIKARVTSKGAIRPYANARGEGKLFNITLMDDTGEIRGTAFNQAVDELYDKLEEGKVYFISKARVNLAKKKFSNLANDYELGLERSTEVEECLETTNVPMARYNFVPLAGLHDLAKDAVCDVIAIVKEVGSLGEITTRQSNKQLKKRELTLVDKSGFSVRLTLWGNQAEEWNTEDNSVIAFKGVRVGDFGGRSLSMSSGSTMAINPDIEEAFILRGWYDSSGAEQAFQSHTSGMVGGSSVQFNRNELMSIEEVKNAKLGENAEKPETFCTRGTIMHIKPDNLWYPACPGRAGQSCNKKVVEDSEGWRCEKCDIVHEKPEYRYMMSMAVSDHSGQAWLQGFNEVGVAVFGISADEMHALKGDDDNEFQTRVAKARCNTFNFACRAKTDSFNDIVRVRYGISKMMPLDYQEESRHLINLLRSPWAM